jgi:hypothetical protein
MVIAGSASAGHATWRLNRLALEFMRVPNAGTLMAAYAERSEAATTSQPIRDDQGNQDD